MTIEASNIAAGTPQHHALHPGGPPATQEPDRVPLPRIAVIFVVAVVTITASIVAVVAMERHPAAQWPTHPAPPLLLGVHQAPIAGPAAGAALRAEQRRALASFGVVDRATGVVSIPIELAKKIVVERATRSPATTTASERGGAP